MLFVVFILGMYMFWSQGSASKKDRNSTFDQWFMSTFVMLVWSRLSYILANWGVFKNVPWFYLPYEKYGNEVHLFRLLPWKFIAIWDGGFLFSGFMMAFLLFNFFYVGFVKNWKWKETVKPIVISANFLQGLLMFIYSVFLVGTQLDAGINIFWYSILFFGVVGGMYLLSTFEKYVSGIALIEMIFMILSFLFASAVFLLAQVTAVDVFNVIITLLFGVYISVLYYKEKTSLELELPEESEIEPYLDSRRVISTNKAIKVPRR